MTCETEILKFLREQEIPKGEVRWEESDCAYLTIKAFEELQQAHENDTGDLQDTISDLDKQLDQASLDFDQLEDRNYDLNNALQECRYDLAAEKEASESLVDQVKDLEENINELGKELSFLRNETERLEVRIQKEEENGIW